MYYLGQITLGATPTYIYLTDQSVNGSNMAKRIMKLFGGGESGTKSTIWKIGKSDRLDLQYDKVAGKNIAPIFDGRVYSNYSYQAGDESFSVVYFDNDLTSAVAISDALKLYSRDKTYDVGLLQLLLAMSLFSNLQGMKIVITSVFVRGQRDPSSTVAEAYAGSFIAANQVF